MAIRASTTIFPNNQAKQKQNEEKDLLMRHNQPQEKKRSNFREAVKFEMDRVKRNLYSCTFKNAFKDVCTKIFYLIDFIKLLLWTDNDLLVSEKN